jgi:hypothetical protein
MDQKCVKGSSSLYRFMAMHFSGPSGDREEGDRWGYPGKEELAVW